MSRKIKSLGGNPVLRTGSGKAGPLVTDNGNFILDVVFEAKAMQDPASLDTKLQNIPGIVETGLFVGLTSAVYIGLENGEVKSKLRNGAKSS